MKPVIPPRLQPVIAQVQANPRLQAGLAVIVLLVGAWAFLALGDIRKAQIDRLEQGRERYIQVQQLSGQEIWSQRAAEADQLARALEAEIPAAASAGLAQAAFQGWLKKITDSQAEPIRLESDAPVRLEGASADIVRVTATVAGSMDPQRTWQLIHRIEASSSLVTIPVLTVRSDGANKTFSLTVQGFYRVPAPARSGGT